MPEYHQFVGHGRAPPEAEGEPEINYRDITCSQDEWDVEEFVSKACIGMCLHHPAFKLLLATFIIANAVVIAARTEPHLEEKYSALFSAVDTIVLTFLMCEVLLNWYYGFFLYWKDGWNIINFLIVVFLFSGMFIPAMNNTTFFHVLRVMRLMQVCTLVKRLAMMVQVILQSFPDMANILILLFVLMLVFSVFGVTLFGSLVPKYFGNLKTALYSLFICVTQDGWINIYDDFGEEGLALKIGGALYFFIFIICGAFICANLLVAVVTTNLEQIMTAYSEQTHTQSPVLSDTAYGKMDDGTDDDLEELKPLHVKEIICGTEMIHHQDLLSYGNLGNLSDSTCDDICIVLEAINENLKEYRVIRDELDELVQEVRTIKFNIEQEQEIVLRNVRGSNISDTMLSSEVIQGKTADVLTALMNLEKSSIMDTDYHKGRMKAAVMKARRQSVIQIHTSAEKSPSSQDIMVEISDDQSTLNQDTLIETPADKTPASQEILEENLEQSGVRRQEKIGTSQSTDEQTGSRQPDTGESQYTAGEEDEH